MKILMVRTSHDKLGNTGRKTGFWLEELLARAAASTTPQRAVLLRSVASVTLTALATSTDAKVSATPSSNRFAAVLVAPIWRVRLVPTKGAESCCRR